MIALIIACNTASVAVDSRIQDLERKYCIPIVTMVSGVRLALRKNTKKVFGKNIVLFGTKFTVCSPIYKNILSDYYPKNIFLLDGTKTERLVAHGLFKIKNEEELSSLEIKEYVNRSIDSFFLGCTCFEFVKHKIRKSYCRKIDFINPSKELSSITRKRLGVLRDNNKKKLTQVKFYTTGNINDWKKNMNIISKKVFGMNIITRKISIRGPCQKISL